MINDFNETRREILINSIKDTDEKINNLQIVIQKVEAIKKDVKDIDTRAEIDNLINSFTTDIKFLEEIKDSDENYLNLNLL
jgi:hypothetical protein